MLVLKAFRYRLDPSKPQEGKLSSWAGATRYVYNRLLAEYGAAWKALGDSPAKERKKSFNKEWSYVGMSRRVTAWRKDLPWLWEVPFHATQNAAKDLATAYKNWWAKRAGPPNFKKKSDGCDSFRETDKAQLDINGQATKLPKLGWVKTKISRPFKGILKQATVCREGAEWYVSILSEVDIEPKANDHPPVGLDLGITQAMTTSDGERENVLSETAAERRHLRKLAKSVSRKKKGSRNRLKAQRRLNKTRRRLRRRVRNAIHVLTWRLAKNHGLVAMEDLDVRSMSASAKGTKEAPGTNVAQKRGLNREIQARAWGEIRRQIEYKCAWYGSRLVLVPAAYSSQECATCAHVDAKSRKSQEDFQCVHCGHKDNADVNAAKVILKRALAAGHAASACGGDVRRRQGHATPVKQEPARGAQKCAV